MGHFTGRLKNAIADATASAKETSGKFYSILNGYGFYDVDDANNGLLDWQRAAVPTYNQKRISALGNAVADMINDFLGNEEYGVMTTVLEDIIEKLDNRAAMTAGEMDAVGGAVGGLTAGASESARQGLSNAIAAAMQGNKFDPDVIPPISIGINGLPISIANLYKPGTYQPNWTFLYEKDKELAFDTKFYDNGGLMIGPNIPIALGGVAKILVLKSVFNVPEVDDNGNPKGDIAAGVTAEEFEKIKAVMDKEYGQLTDEEKSFSLTEAQLQAAYFKYIQLVLWGAIINKNNWSYLHWGVLSHNSCPEPVKTAVCSFLKTNGLALDKDVNSPAAMISYCLNVGMAYHIGRNTPVTLVGIKGQKLKALEKEGDKTPVEVTNYDKAVKFDGGVPKDSKLANFHFLMIADILAHLSNGSSPNDVKLRKRRVDEANLIYKYCGMPTITYGDATGSYDNKLKADALEKRGFLDLMKAKIYVFPNTSGDYGGGADVQIKFQNNTIDPDGTILQERSKNVIKWLANQAGIKTIRIGSLRREAESQGSAMANNWHNGKRIKYGTGGTRVNKVYADYAKKVSCTKPYTPTGKVSFDDGSKIPDSDFAKVKAMMIEECKKCMDEGVTVSAHCDDVRRRQAVDISHKNMLQVDNYTMSQVLKFCQACKDAVKQGILQNFIMPDGLGDPKAKTGEPCIHIVIWTSGKGSEIPVPMAGVDPDALAPTPGKDVEVVVTNMNLITKAALDGVYAKDYVDKKNNS